MQWITSVSTAEIFRTGAAGPALFYNRSLLKKTKTAMIKDDEKRKKDAL